MTDSHSTIRPYDPFAGASSTSTRSSPIAGLGLGAPGPGSLQLPPLSIGVQPRTSHQRSSIDFATDGQSNDDEHSYVKQSGFKPSPFLMNSSPDDLNAASGALGSSSGGSNLIGTIHGSPQSMYMTLPRRSSDMSDAEDSEKKRKRSSLVLPDQGGGLVARRAVTLGHADGLASAGGSETDEEATPETKKGTKRAATTVTPTMTSSGMPLLTSCEACRKGKRRCEPSPLVPPNHPDIAKLPCARCRRFAVECVRVKVNRRKGPAPVDLSAISDAVHGFQNGSSSGSGDHSHIGDMSAPPLPPDPMRRGTVIQPQDPTVSGMLDQSALPMYPPNPGKYATSPSFPLLAASPSLSISALPENLDHVVSGPVIDHIINLFFDYVYPLTPCLHRPTFIAHLTARMDKTDPIFFALTLNVIASTLVQVPRSLVNLEKPEVESLARRCVRVAKAKFDFVVWEDEVPVQSAFVVISYLEGIVHLLLGNNLAHVEATGRANQLALAMRLNEESSYVGLDPVESEIRRRIYWLLFQADKSTACLRARVIGLRLDDAAGLLLPSEVDDEQITPTGIMPQPPEKTPLISGFNIVTNLFRILNDALILQRRKVTPTANSILADLELVNELRERVKQTTLNVAEPFRLRKAYNSRLSSPATDWETKLHTRFLDFFQSAGETTHALDSFLVMQGNILVTQHVVRLVLLQTRESLFQQLSLLTQLPVDGIRALTGAQTAEGAEDIACELLDGLNSLPVECVATNGPSLVQKVRFVAVQLMEYPQKPSSETARAATLLKQFLSVLCVIEGMYLFGRDISAE